MLQYIVKPIAGRNTCDRIKAAIAGGCRWFEIHMPDATDDDVRQVVQDCIETCREADAFLVVYSHVAVVEALRVSGIRVGSAGAGPVMRLKLGAHAVVGVTVNSASEIIGLRGRDIDYAVADAGDPQRFADMVSAVRAAGIEIPVVADNAALDTVAALRDAGATGLAMGEAIDNAPDTEDYVRKVMEAWGSTF